MASRRDAISVAMFFWQEKFMKALIKGLAVLAVAFGVFAAAPALADGYKDCTKIDKATWKPAAEAEAKATAAGYEVYGAKEGKLYELFYSPEDLSLKKTIAK